jgi:hypothetical protein
MRRAILNTLINWKAAKNRKVLLLRGARQVGKTYIVRELARGFRPLFGGKLWIITTILLIRQLHIGEHLSANPLF